MRLEIGQLSDRVVVEAFLEQLQTESSTLGRVTSGEQVKDLPLVTRNYTQIVSLNPGVAADVNDAGAIGHGNLGLGAVPISSNGGTQADNNVQMNGVGRACAAADEATQWPIRDANTSDCGHQQTVRTPGLFCFQLRLPLFGRQVHDQRGLAVIGEEQVGRPLLLCK